RSGRVPRDAAGARPVPKARARTRRAPGRAHPEGVDGAAAGAGRHARRRDRPRAVIRARVGLTRFTTGDDPMDTIAPVREARTRALARTDLDAVVAIDAVVEGRTRRT